MTKHSRLTLPVFSEDLLQWTPASCPQISSPSVLFPTLWLGESNPALLRAWTSSTTCSKTPPQGRHTCYNLIPTTGLAAFPAPVLLTMHPTVSPNQTPRQQFSARHRYLCTLVLCPSGDTTDR